MDFSQEFNRIMAHQTDLALATSVQDIPNVRIVSFYYDPQKKGILFFSTERNNLKVTEFQANSNVAFSTIPAQENEHVRVHRGVIEKSKLGIDDLKDAFIKKVPDYEMVIDAMGHLLDVYEIHFTEAVVTIDFAQSEKITF